ncbi:MAG: LPS export ABC transporter permease LptG [Candidatus Rokubacteria bacterium]|nr:LPS export ABC transporter permease LptG [Candidatus Rokubacteria bacterium]
MRRPPIGLIDRYVLRELVTPFAFGVGLFTFFLVIDRIYQLTELVITKGVPFHLVTGLLVFMLPSFLGYTLPMALLVAALLAGGRLAGDLEVVALKSAGVSLFRLLRPILLAGAAVTLAVALITMWLTPVANRQFQQQLFKILESRAVAGLRERIFNTTFGDVVLYVEDVSASQVALRGLLVSDERDPRLTRIITAAEGRILTDEATRRIVLRLMDGAVNEADVMPANPPATGGLPAPRGGAAANTRYRYTTFTLYDMTLPLDSPLRGATRLDKPERDLSLGELRREIARLAADGPGRRPYELEWHKRLALPLATFVFLLVGFPLAVRSHRGGRSIALLGSLAILVAYYVLLTSLEGMGLRGTLPVWPAIWLPNLLFATVGTTLLVATAREWRAPTPPAAWRLMHAIVRRFPTRRPGTRPIIVSPVGPRDSTHIVDRYVIREHLVFMVICLGIATALVLTIDLLDTLDRYLRVKPPLAYIFQHFLYRLPADVHAGLPVVMLVATVFLFITLNRHHELTALKAAGISVYRVAAPVLALGSLVALGAGLFQELVLPVLNERGEEVDRVKIRGQLPRHLQSRQRLWVRSADSRFYRVELLAPGTNDLYGVTVLEIDRSFRLLHRLDARRAHWTPRGWELSDGAFRDLAPDGKVRTVPFARTALELPESIDDFTRIQKPVSAMSYRELSEYVTRLEAAGYQARKYLVDLYEKLSFPLVNLVMVLVAVPFAVHSPRSGRLFGVGLAIVIMAGYLVVHYTAISFARADLLPPIVAAWTANVIFAGIGLTLFARLRT